jgi:predicted nucleotidyltransferase
MVKMNVPFMSGTVSSSNRAQAALRRPNVPRIVKKANVHALLNRLVKRIVDEFHPEKIILFGSHARGEAGPDSDVDLLIVMPVEGSKLDKLLEIRRAVRDLPVPLDVIITKPEDFVWRKDIVGTIEWPAAREGKVLYARAILLMVDGDGDEDCPRLGGSERGSEGTFCFSAAQQKERPVRRSSRCQTLGGSTRTKKISVLLERWRKDD